MTESSLVAERPRTGTKTTGSQLPCCSRDRLRPMTENGSGGRRLLCATHCSCRRGQKPRMSGECAGSCAAAAIGGDTLSDKDWLWRALATVT